MRIINELRGVFGRNKKVIGIVAVAFFFTLFVASIVTYVILVTSPQLVNYVADFVSSERALIGLPPPRTGGFYQLIFLNNIGHFWNPSRAWVWLPLIGAFSLGYELVLNAVIIGAVASFASITRGPAFALAGLAPHGVLELPAFILEFAALTRWHIVASRAVYGKMSGRQVDRPLFMEGLKDTVVLSFISVALFAVAAYVETFITPGLIGR
jgi:stage II sporulation protein M